MLLATGVHQIEVWIKLKTRLAAASATNCIAASAREQHSWRQWNDYPVAGTVHPI